jgi:hypothetical protein
MERDVASLEREIQLIQQPGYVSQAARGYLLGTPGEIPFTVRSERTAAAGGRSRLDVGIKPDARCQNSSPLDSWLQVLFGTGQ